MASLYVYIHKICVHTREVGKVLLFDRSTLVYQSSTVVWFSLSVTRFLQSCKQEGNEVEICCGSSSALFVLFLESRSDGSCFNKEEADVQGHSRVCSRLSTFVAAGHQHFPLREFHSKAEANSQAFNHTFARELKDILGDLLQSQWKVNGQPLQKEDWKEMLEKTLEKLTESLQFPSL